MRLISYKPAAFGLLGLLAFPLSATLSAQNQGNSRPAMA